MPSFDLSEYGPVFANLLAERHRCALGPGEPNRSLAEPLAALSVESAFAHAKIADADMAGACLAGVWLRLDFLEESHRISQSIATPTGSYWHGIMHRREPDYSNSKYWFHRVGRHPAFAPLAADARELVDASVIDDRPFFLRGERDWDPLAFVDFCEKVIDTASAEESLAEEIQEAEWRRLFDFCYRAAIGRTN